MNDPFEFTTADKTMEVWVNFSQLSGDGMTCILSKDEGGGSNFKYILAYAANYAGYSNTFMLHFNGPGIGAQWIAVSNSCTVTLGVWHHLALVKTGNVFSFYLDGIQDPGNMGTIMRIADWFSIPYIFCSETSVDIWNPKVVQSSMGAFLRVKAFEVNFQDIKTHFPNLPIFATILRGDNIFKMDAPSKGIIVIGNEGSGISDTILNQTDFKISIPGGGGAESLNAGVATGIVCAVLCNINRSISIN